MGTSANVSARPRTLRWRQLALPSEHGGWSFLLEPLAVGLAVSFSAAGLWIALMTVGAFLCRQPLKVLILDRRGLKDNDRANAALMVLTIYGAIFFAGLFGLITTAGWYPLSPFLPVLPFFAFQLFSDISRKSREVLPEVASAIAISASAAAISLAGGREPLFAGTLWLIFTLRAVPSVLYVRQRLLLEKGKSFSRAVPSVSHFAAFAAVAILAYFRLVPVLAAIPIAVFAWRAGVGLSPGRKPLRAIQIGVREVIYGALFSVLIILGYLLEL